MSLEQKIYLRAKAMLIAVILDEVWSRNNHTVAMAVMDLENARESLS